MPQFKIGDVINSSLSSPQVIEEIRIGVDIDFPHKFYNASGCLCYVLRHLYGKKRSHVYTVKAVDSDHHLKGSELFEAYEKARVEAWAEIGETYPPPRETCSPSKMEF
jgi:hypothetical protein